jgi:hypothetical protein
MHSSWIKGAAFCAVFGLLVPFLVLEGVFQLLPVSYPPANQPVNAATPVARFEPNVHYPYSHDWDFAIVTQKRTNNFGYNFARDFEARAGTPLLMVIGDSFVEANAVDAGKSAAEVLDVRLGGAGRVYSIGVSGAPLSQYLVFAEFAAATLRPDAMAFVIISNDFDESFLKYRGTPRFHYFVERDGEMRLHRVDYQLSSAKRLLRQSAFVRYAMLNVAVGERAEALVRAMQGRSRPAAYLGHRDSDPPEVMASRIRDSERATDLFLEMLPSRAGVAPEAILFVLDAVRPAIYSEETLRAAETSFHARMRAYFERAAAARGYHVLDLQPAFIARHREDGVRFEFPTDSHWNELANALVAGEIEKTPLFGRVFRRDGAKLSLR